MKLETAKAIVEFCGEQQNSRGNYSKPEIHPEYSGRGMFGQTTAAISCPDPYKAIGEALQEILGEIQSEFDIEENVRKAIEISEALTQARTDSMGFDVVLY